MDGAGFEPAASTSGRCQFIRRNEILEYIRIVELKGLCDIHIYEMKKFLNNYLKYIDYKSKPKEKNNWNITHFRNLFESIYELSANEIKIPFGLGKPQELKPFE